VAFKFFTSDVQRILLTDFRSVLSYLLACLANWLVSGQHYYGTVGLWQTSVSAFSVTSLG